MNTTLKLQKQAKDQAKTSAAKAQNEKEVDETSAVQGDGEVEPMGVSGLEKDGEAADNTMPESEPHSLSFIYSTVLLMALHLHPLHQVC